MARAKAEAPPGASYRIKELSDRSGFSRQTIRFYIAQGLLPEPIKTSHNMGWYSERHLELLLLIQKLQHERSLVETFEESTMFPIKVQNKTYYLNGPGQEAVKNGEVFRAIVNGQSIKL